MSRVNRAVVEFTVGAKVDIAAATSEMMNRPRSPMGMRMRITPGRMRSGFTAPS